MPNDFVHEGRANLYATDEFQAKRRQIKKAIAARYAARLATAGPLRRLWLRFQMHRALQRRWRRMAPSPESLWAHEAGSHGSCPHRTLF